MLKLMLGIKLLLKYWNLQPLFKKAKEEILNVPIAPVQPVTISDHHVLITLKQVRVYSFECLTRDIH